MRLLEVATTLTPDQLREFEMKYGSPHHSRSQSVKPRSRPNSLTLPPARTRVASMPNTGAEEHYYRLRHFSITGKGVINRGDYLKSKLEKSQGSVSSNSASTDQLGPPSRQSSCVSCPGSHNYSYRVVMLGASAVGKTSLISQFMTSEYLAPYDTSIDDDFAEKSVSVLLDGEESELIFIDHPSSQLTPDSWMESSASAYCVVYSASDALSFNVANECLAALWAADITRKKAVILVSNKSDLVRSKIISTQEGKDTARRYDSKFIETSVGLNHRVDELLVGVLTQIRLKDAERKKPQEEQKTGLFPKSRGKGTSASLKVKGLLSKVWARDSKSKSCENLHVL
ncbi:unnamed protein product [Nezara viridula]|uniref:Uncharacterized protein n=1 Tax=Nezara viridula TaxID=85310 RepID=A0A9P0EA15_NEZVI|nr:unnamed protein product [Nezara viridula]